MRVSRNACTPRLIAAWLFLASLLLSVPVGAEPEPNPEDSLYSLDDFPKREELFFEEFPVVFSAARREQPVARSPSSVTVITSEEIRRSGATTLADLLRRVPGLDVFRVNRSDAKVSARGLNEPSANRSLVLIDGRSVYADFLGIVFWDSLPVALEEIERVEIVRGPGSALYGANAFSGVINIITKTPEQLRGTTLSTTVGQFDTVIGTVIHAGVKEPWSYKVVGSWDETDSMEFEDTNARENAKGSVLIGYRFDEDNELTFSTGFDDGDGAAQLGLDTFDWEGTFYHAKLNYDYEEWQFQAFYNLSAIDSVDSTSGEERPLTNHVFDLEFQHTLRPREFHTVIWGMEYRHNRLNSREIIGDSESENIFSFFVQDEFRALPDLTLTGGARLDYHPLTGLHFSPRLSALYEPWRGHIFRISFAQAFRNPASIESYANLEITVDSPLLPAFPITLSGNDDLDAEEITSFEIGYGTTLLDNRLRLKADMFYHVLDNCVNTPPLRIDPLPPPIGIELGFENGGKFDAYGGELSLNYRLTERLSAYFNYSYQVLEAREDAVVLPGDEAGERVKSAPAHKFNAGAYAEFDNGLNLNVDIHFVDDIEASFRDLQVAILDPTDFVRREDVGEYLLVNARLGYKIPGHDIEAALIVHNLLNDIHREWAEAVGAEEFEREFLFQVTGKF